MTQQTLVVLAGGFGTRLRSAIADLPKPLAPVMQRPYLHYLLEMWWQHGIDTLIFSLHYQAELIKKFLASHPLANQFSIKTLIEPQPLGTGGAVAFAVNECCLENDFIVTNADTWLGAGIEEMCATITPAMAVVHVDNTERYGGVMMHDNRITAFTEKGEHSISPGWINAGLYRLHASLFRRWDGQAFSLERDLFPRLVERQQLHAVPLHTDFIDIGIPQDYTRFCRWIESGRKDVL